MTDHLTEDWHGRYWWSRVIAGARLSRFRLCTDPECLWPVAIERRPDGWWWEHDDLAGNVASGGPFDYWQEAASAAVEAGVVAPDRRLDP